MTTTIEVYRSFETLTVDHPHGFTIALINTGNIRVRTLTCNRNEYKYEYYVEPTDEFNYHTIWSARVNEQGTTYAEALLQAIQREEIEPYRTIKERT